MHNNKVEHDNLIYTFRPYVEELHPLIDCVELSVMMIMIYLSMTGEI